MGKFYKWFFISIVSAGLGIILVLNIEGWSFFDDKRIFLAGIFVIFILAGYSLFSLVKANRERKKDQLIISLLTALIPLLLIVMNCLLFIVYFVGK